MLGALAGFDEPLLIAAVATSLAWLLAAGALYVVRQPNQPPTGPRTLDVGPEPPAVANFLVNRLRVTRDALPATLLDLAARGAVEIEQRGPGTFHVRLRRTADDTLTAYELRLLRHLEQRAHDGVVPAQALTTGPTEHSKRWFRAFASAVVADAQRRGLSRERLDRRLFAAFGATALIPAALVWAAAGEVGGGLVAWVGALSALGWIRARHPQQPTAAGDEAAARWLGVRAELAENEVFATRSPLEVVLWDRLLAYGAALGVAGGAVGPLPMGVESDTEAWSAYGGSWRAVKIVYPRFVPLGWGAPFHAALLSGVAILAAAGFALFVLASLIADANGSAVRVLAAIAAIVCAAVGIGVVLIVLSVADLGGGLHVVGPVLRLRAYGDEKRRRHYVAVDDGRSGRIRAFRLDAVRYGRLEQGQLVELEVSPALKGVRTIRVQNGEDASPAAFEVESVSD